MEVSRLNPCTRPVCRKAEKMLHELSVAFAERSKLKNLLAGAHLDIHALNTGFGVKRWPHRPSKPPSRHAPEGAGKQFLFACH